MDIETQTKNLEIDGLKLELKIKKHCLGKFRIPAANLDFEWRGNDNTQQRPVDEAHVRALQEKFVRAGLRRVHPRNHIDAILPRRLFDEAVKLTAEHLGVDPKSITTPTIGISETDPAWNIDGLDGIHTDVDGLTELDKALTSLW